MNYKTYEVREYTNGDKQWYKDGKLHREDGPAVESHNGDKAWYKDGKRHREDGPACEYNDGSICYYIEGVYYNEKDYYYDKINDILIIDGKITYRGNIVSKDTISMALKEYFKF